VSLINLVGYFLLCVLVTFGIGGAFIK